MINDSYDVNACFKTWIATDPRNPDIWLERGDYCASVGGHQKARKYYHHAFSLSDDDGFKEMAMHKMAAALTVQQGLAAQFNKMADNHDFFNFDSVDAEFAAQVLGADEFKDGDFG